jgi:hypothetical protein
MTKCFIQKSKITNQKSFLGFKSAIQSGGFCGFSQKCGEKLVVDIIV